MKTHPRHFAAVPYGHLWLSLSLWLSATACEPDLSESNDSPICQTDRFDGLPEPPVLEVGRYEELSVCSDRIDRYRLEPIRALSVVVRVEASQPVTIRLLDQGVVLAQDEGIRIEVNVIARDSLQLEVEGRGTYQLDVIMNEVPLSCAETRAQAFELEVGFNPRGLCENGTDWIRVSQRPNEAIRLSFDGDNRTARVDVFQAIDDAIVRVDTGRYGLGSVMTIERMLSERSVLWVRVQSDDSSGYGVQLSRSPLVTRSRRATGSVQFERRIVTHNGLSTPIERPAAAIRYDVLVAQTGLTLATGWTDDEGRFEITYQEPEGSETEFRIVADARSERASVRVGPERGHGVPWGRVLGPIDNAHRDGYVWRVPEGLAMASALSIVTTARDGLLELENSHLPDTEVGQSMPLHYRWQPGLRADCGTCFIPVGEAYVELSGQAPDSDEWDDFVIQHELGHYVSLLYGRDDSPGGRHDGSPTIPAVAWSEGFATYLASMLMDTPEQLDYRDDGVRMLELETLGDDVQLGTISGMADGLISEWRVAALLWDLADAPAGDDESVALGHTAVLKPAFGRLVTDWDDRGAPGIDLVDYLDALLCDSSDAQPIEAALENHDFPYEQTACMMKAARIESTPTSFSADSYRVSSGVAYWR